MGNGYLAGDEHRVDKGFAGMKIEELEASLATAHTEQEKIDTLNGLAWHIYEQHPQRGFELASEAHQRAQTGQFATNPYLIGMADSLAIIGWYHYEIQAEHTAAIDAVSHALTIANAIDYQRGQVRAKLHLTLIYRRIGNYPQALENAFAALKQAQALNSLLEIGQAHRAIANIYVNMGDYDRGLISSNAALDIFKRLNDGYRRAIMLNNISMTLMKQTKFDAALDYGFQALAIFTQIESMSGKAAVQDTIGQSYLGQGDYEAALNYFAKSLDDHAAAEARAYVCQQMLFMGKAYIGLERYDAALPCLQEALSIAEGAGTKPHLYECHHELSSVYEKLGDLTQALRHHKQFLDVYQQVINEQSIQKMMLTEVVHRTEQAQAEAEIQRQLREQDRRYFERLSQMRDQLISTTSHDLKNPLGAIINYVYLLRMAESNNAETSHHYLDRIEAQVELMRDLIRDLLELAKLETRTPLDLETVTLGPFLAEIITEHVDHAHTRHIHLEPPVLNHDFSVRIDLRQMRRVMNNLLSNAIKYTPDGGRVHISVTQDTDHIIVAVEDTGIGIPQHDLPYIFERFYRVDNQAHASIEGTGLGLAIVKSIVEQHGGSISVESQEGVGSRFNLTIPAVVGVTARS